jgi:hypothetical protein
MTYTMDHSGDRSSLVCAPRKAFDKMFRSNSAGSTKTYQKGRFYLHRDSCLISTYMLPVSLFRDSWALFNNAPGSPITWPTKLWANPPCYLSNSGHMWESAMSAVPACPLRCCNKWVGIQISRVGCRVRQHLCSVGTLAMKILIKYMHTLSPKRFDDPSIQTTKFLPSLWLEYGHVYLYIGEIGIVRLGRGTVVSCGSLAEWGGT